MSGLPTPPVLTIDVLEGDAQEQACADLMAMDADGMMKSPAPPGG